MAGAVCGLLLLIVIIRKSGGYLVMDNRQKSDAIVVTQGDELDAGYWMGMQLLKQGYGRELLLDARANRIFFGRTQADLADEFIRKTAGSLANRVSVCPILADTTAEEAYEAGKCLKKIGARSVLLLSDDFHTHRSLLIFSHLLPAHHWSVAPVRDPKRFGDEWWRKRVWIRTAVVEFQHLIWWEVVDRWRFQPADRTRPPAAVRSGPAGSS